MFSLLPPALPPGRTPCLLSQQGDRHRFVPPPQWDTPRDTAPCGNTDELLPGQVAQEPEPPITPLVLGVTKRAGTVPCPSMLSDTHAHGWPRTWMSPHTDVPTHGCPHTDGCSSTQTPSHTDVPTHRCPHTRISLHTDVPSHGCPRPHDTMSRLGWPPHHGLGSPGAQGWPRCWTRWPHM